MRKTLFVACIFLLFANNGQAQLLLKDIDLMIGKNGIFSTMLPKRLEPNASICFDKKITFSSNVGGRTWRGCMYLNTSAGYVGMGMKNRPSDCDVSANDPDLNFLVVTKMGQNITYTNDKREGKRFMVLPIRVREATAKYVKKFGRQDGDRRRFTDLSLPTWAYYDPTEGATPNVTFRYLYGNGYPMDGTMKNYLGNLGIGFGDISGDTFLILSQEKDDKYTSIERLENVNFCFDGSGFKDGNAAAIQAEEEIVADTRQDLDARETQLTKSNAYCVTFYRNILEHDKLMAKKAEKALELQKSGSFNAMNKEHQRIMSESQDVIDQVIKDRLKLLSRQCDASYTLNKIATTESAKKRAKDKMTCLQTDIDKLTALEEELDRIDKANPNNPNKAMADKNVLYMRTRMSSRSACN